MRLHFWQHNLKIGDVLGLGKSALAALNSGRVLYRPDGERLISFKYESEVSSIDIPVEK